VNCWALDSPCRSAAGSWVRHKAVLGTRAGYWSGARMTAGLGDDPEPERTAGPAAAWHTAGSAAARRDAAVAEDVSWSDSGTVAGGVDPAAAAGKAWIHTGGREAREPARAEDAIAEPDAAEARASDYAGRGRTGGKARWHPSRQPKPPGAMIPPSVCLSCSPQPMWINLRILYSKHLD